jgi:hypothetical protein
VKSLQGGNRPPEISPVGNHPQRMVNPWVVTFAVMLATFIEVLDTTVVSVSIPHFAGNLASTNEEGTWVVTSYPVSNAVVLPILGWLANYMGRKAPAADLCRRIHPHVAAARLCDFTAAVDYFPHFARADWPRPAAAGPGDSARNFSQRTTRPRHGTHPGRENGQLDQHLQSDAQYRRQRGHRHHDHVPGPPSFTRTISWPMFEPAIRKR